MSKISIENIYRKKVILMNKKWLCILFSLLLIIGVTACNAQSESTSPSKSNIWQPPEFESRVISIPDPEESSNNEAYDQIISDISSEFPMPDIKYEPVECTIDFLKKYDDLLSPFIYQKSAENISDDEILKGFTKLYQSAHSVYNWYRDPASLQQEMDETALKIIDQEGIEWRPAKRIQTLGGMYALVDSIFTQRYRLNALDGYDERFCSYNDRLYINCSSGGLGDPYKPLFDTARVLAKTPEVILIEMDIGFNNAPTETPAPTIFTLIHQGSFWVLDNWL